MLQEAKQNRKKRKERNLTKIIMLTFNVCMSFGFGRVGRQSNRSQECVEVQVDVGITLLKVIFASKSLIHQFCCLCFLFYIFLYLWMKRRSCFVAHGLWRTNSIVVLCMCLCHQTQHKYAVRLTRQNRLWENYVYENRKEEKEEERASTRMGRRERA